MKKIILLFAIVSTLVAGVAFAGDNQTAPATNRPFSNGITYFDLGPANRTSFTLKDDEAATHNGITFFDLAKAGAHRACVLPEGERMAKRFNGITML